MGILVQNEGPFPAPGIAVYLYAAQARSSNSMLDHRVERHPVVVFFSESRHAHVRSARCRARALALWRAPRRSGSRPRAARWTGASFRGCRATIVRSARSPWLWLTLALWRRSLAPLFPSSLLALSGDSLAEDLPAEATPSLLHPAVCRQGVPARRGRRYRGRVRRAAPRAGAARRGHWAPPVPRPRVRVKTCARRLARPSPAAAGFASFKLNFR